MFLTRLLCLVILLTACSRHVPPYIELVAKIDANSHSATMVELVFVYDDAVVGQIQTMSGADWFNQRNAMIASFPNKLQVQGFELVPGVEIAPVTLPDISANADGVFVFAELFSTGNDKLDISNMPSVRITVAANGIEANPIERPEVNAYTN